METLLKPENNDGLWISYLGGKWLSAGPAVRLRASEFTRVGEYEGFPVFVKQGDETRRTIYLPTRDELIAPYRLKE
jgi:hypothetical protein